MILVYELLRKQVRESITHEEGLAPSLRPKLGGSNAQLTLKDPARGSQLGTDRVIGFESSDSVVSKPLRLAQNDPTQMVLCPTTVLLLYSGEPHQMKAWFALFGDILEGFDVLKPRNPRLCFNYYKARKDSRVSITAVLARVWLLEGTKRKARGGTEARGCCGARNGDDLGFLKPVKEIGLLGLFL
ncbi:hypothetical protein CXB51_017942 [Gossypium anomalum]|uniref:Uncharacterized protein n=1 Tax=Gossypium anomalum TaxID=47600 RepID=A0A8J6CWA3_9ROSI|nr:hypothetical protein CXB51_017942 [Gossypium anomalum]